MKKSLVARSVSLVAFVVGTTAACDAGQAGILSGTATSDSLDSAEGFAVGVVWQFPAAECADLTTDDATCATLPYTTSGGAPLSGGFNPEPSGYLRGEFPATFERSLDLPPLNASYTVANGSGGDDELDGDGRGEFAFGYIIATHAKSIDVVEDVREADDDAPIGLADIRVVFARDVADDQLAAWGGLHNGVNLVRVVDGVFEVLADDADIEVSVTNVAAVREQFRYSDSAVLRASDDVRPPEL